MIGFLENNILSWFRFLGKIVSNNGSNFIFKDITWYYSKYNVIPLSIWVLEDSLCHDPNHGKPWFHHNGLSLADFQWFMCTSFLRCDLLRTPSLSFPKNWGVGWCSFHSIQFSSWCLWLWLWFLCLWLCCMVQFMKLILLYHTFSLGSMLIWGCHSYKSVSIHSMVSML